MENLLKIYSEFINESSVPNGDFIEFSKSRLNGASKIAKSAKEKGGASMLTYHHFNVKLPYYKKAANGKFNIEESRAELSKQMKILESGIHNKSVTLEQIEFQKIMGIIEVLGELIIKNQSLK